MKLIEKIKYIFINYCTIFCAIKLFILLSEYFNMFFKTSDVCCPNIGGDDLTVLVA